MLLKPIKLKRIQPFGIQQLLPIKLEKDKWEYILNPSPYENGTPFFDNDVHVTHFTISGLKKAMKEFGCNNLEVVHSGLLAKPLK